MRILFKVVEKDSCGYSSAHCREISLLDNVYHRRATFLELEKQFRPLHCNPNCSIHQLGEEKWSKGTHSWSGCTCWSELRYCIVEPFKRADTCCLKTESACSYCTPDFYLLLLPIQKGCLTICYSYVDVRWCLLPFVNWGQRIECAVCHCGNMHKENSVPWTELAFMCSHTFPHLLNALAKR